MKDLVTKNAQWRLGGALECVLKSADQIRADRSFPPVSLALIDTRDNTCRSVAAIDIRVWFDATAGKFVTGPDAPAVMNRFASFANLALSCGTYGAFLVNMADAQSYCYQVGGELLPVFQFSRRAAQRGVILCPHDDWYMGPGSPNLPLDNTDRLSFAEKKPQAVWRGVLSGTYRYDDRMIWGQNIKREIFDNGLALSADGLFNALCHFSRFRLVSRYHNEPFLDVGLVHEPNCRHHDKIMTSQEIFALLRPLFKPAMSHEAQLGCRYILCIEGNDYASGLFWALRSNSVVMMPVPRWQTILHYGLTPWEHYIPLRRDFSDLIDKIRWGNDNVARCEAISRQANAHIAVYADREFREQVDKQVFEIYYDNFISETFRYRTGTRPLSRSDYANSDTSYGSHEGNANAEPAVSATATSYESAVMEIVSPAANPTPIKDHAWQILHGHAAPEIKAALPRSSIWLRLLRRLRGKDGFGSRE